MEPPFALAGRKGSAKARDLALAVLIGVES